MNLQLSIQHSEKLALRNPESTELGRKIVRHGLVLMQEMGYEHFTFKKLAERIETTEASIYRYFENKHRLLLYFLTWYWNILEYSVVFALQNMTDPVQKIHKVLEILSHDLPQWADQSGLDKSALHQMAIAESSKTYLIKEVDDINREHLFKPYKDLCGRISDLFLEYNPLYPYPRALASSVVEMAHFQVFFAEHLPALTDLGKGKEGKQVVNYLQHLVFSALGA
jgi:AcrR family transcriptional regulator